MRPWKESLSLLHTMAPDFFSIFSMQRSITLEEHIAVIHFGLVTGLSFSNCSLPPSPIIPQSCETAVIDASIVQKANLSFVV